MAKAATSGQARAFNAMTVSRIDEEALKQIDGEKLQKIIDKPEEFIPNFIAWINNGCKISNQNTVQTLKNLAFICEILIRDFSEFVVWDRFQPRAEDKVSISLRFGGNFINWILNPMKMKKVSLVNGLKLKKFSLLKSMNDTEIQNELQNPKPIDVEIFLPLIWAMMLSQKNGEVKENGLLNNGYANIFHVKLDDNRVVAVSVFWHTSGWRLGADGFDYLGRFEVGGAFFTPATA